MSHVLLVDGNPNFRKTLKILLSDAGYPVDEAADTEQCSRLLAQRCYAVVITDLCVERGDGLDVLWSLVGSTTQRIVITTQLTPEAQDWANYLGVYCYIEKPYNVDYLLNLVREAKQECERR